MIHSAMFGLDLPESFSLENRTAMGLVRWEKKLRLGSAEACG